jgi:Ni/Co efflux regulator RcnB
MGRPHPRFRGPEFNYPPGYSYRRWSLGERLPLLFLTPGYFFSDYAALGLDAPPYGYEWVRYGPDLLLVQLGTGQVVEVVPGAIY